MQGDYLLETINLSKMFRSRGILRRRETLAVDDVSFSMPADRPSILTLAGESGSGKTTTARLILGLLRPTSGSVVYKGKDVWKMPEEEWRNFRREVQAIFQDPYATFNPVHKVDRVLSLPLRRLNKANSREEEQDLIVKALEDTGLKPEDVLGKYPHELSGGQRQRVMVARAFLLKPKLIVTDEPVSMIDASLRANILNHMLTLKENLKVSFLYITHDLSTARYISDEIIIMYLGSIMETGLIDKVVLNPLHPYVHLLTDSIPKPNPDERWKERIDLSKTELSSSSTSVSGCKFYPRCSQRIEKCQRETPKLVRQNSRYVACFLYE